MCTFCNSEYAFSSTATFLHSNGGNNAGAPTFAAKPTWSVDQIAHYLTDGYADAVGGLKGGFDVSGDRTITVNISDLEPAGQWFARKALQAWAAVSGLKFVEVTDNEDINFQNTDPSGAYAQSYGNGTHRTYANINIPTSWYAGEEYKLDSYSYQTYLHEIGHALGLGHSGNYNGNGSFDSNAHYANDNWQMTVMSYFSQTEANQNADFAYLLTPMIADINAIHDLYGRPSNVNTGNTVYGYGSNAAGPAKDFVNQSRDVAMTIFDSTGRDTLNFSQTSENQVLDLRAGKISNVMGLKGNLLIAETAIIENAKGGSGADIIRGNTAFNILTGNGGQDTISGYSGNDTIFGGRNNDLLVGGSGNDSIYGGDDNDLIKGDSGTDRLLGDNGHDVVLGGSQNDTMFGGAGNDRLNGGRHNDLIFGNSGNDTLHGEDGNDKIYGEAGNDFIFAGTGHDKLFGSDGNDKMYGQDGDDTLGGGAGHDTLYGGSGKDIMLGGTQKDILFGGSGNDKLYGDTWSDTLDAGAGNDILYGGTQNDLLKGGSGNDKLYGQSGNDILKGGLGNDTMVGGTGADQFHFVSGQDLVIDFDAAENDRIYINTSLLGGGSTNAAKVLNQYGSIENGNLVLDFGGQNVLTIKDVTSLQSMEDSLYFI